MQLDFAFLGCASQLYDSKIVQQAEKWYNMTDGSADFNPLSGYPYGFFHGVCQAGCTRALGSCSFSIVIRNKADTIS